MNQNFQPIIKCPHCGRVAHPEISGWGGELSTRVKDCRHCGQVYRLLVYSFTDKEIDCTTGYINGKRSRIEYLKKRIREKLAKITNKEADWAEEFLRVNAICGGKQN